MQLKEALSWVVNNGVLMARTIPHNYSRRVKRQLCRPRRWRMQLAVGDAFDDGSNNGWGCCGLEAGCSCLSALKMLHLFIYGRWRSVDSNDLCIAVSLWQQRLDLACAVQCCAVLMEAAFMDRENVTDSSSIGSNQHAGIVITSSSIGMCGAGFIGFSHLERLINQLQLVGTWYLMMYFFWCVHYSTLEHFCPCSEVVRLDGVCHGCFRSAIPLSS